MTSVDILPDVIPVVRAWLISQAEVSALIGTRVSTRSPETPTYPYVLLERFGGTPAVRQRLDRARIQVSVWAADESTASLVARTVRAYLHRMEGYRHQSAVVTSVEDEQGLQSLPETIRSVPTARVVFSVAICSHVP